jgi:signal transduction histidine kinase
MGVVLLAVLTLLLPVSSYLAQTERARLLNGLERDAFVLAGRSTEVLEHTDDVLTDTASDTAVTDLVRLYRGTSGARVVITDDTGVAVVTSDDDEARVGLNYGTRPEIATALAGGIATGTRRSDTLGVDLLYVAVPVLNGDAVVGAVRLPYAASVVTAAVNAKVGRLGLVGLTTVLISGVAAVVVARGVTRQLRAPTDLTEGYAGRNLTARAETEHGAAQIRSLARSFNGMAARLSDTVERQRRFAADASHQLRTPLTALRLRLERARDLAGSDEVADRLAAAEDELDRLDATVESLLTLSRAEGVGLRLEPRDVAGAAAARVAFWQPLAAERNVSLEFRGPEVAWASCAHDAFDQILDNYLDNALTVSPEGGQVAVAVVTEAHRVEVHVLDEGPGLSPEERDRAFDRFWRGRPDGSGTGLGLSIVAELARGMGAEVGLAQRVSGGLDAWVRFAAVRTPAAGPTPGAP